MIPNPPDIHELLHRLEDDKIRYFETLGAVHEVLSQLLLSQTAQIGPSQYRNASNPDRLDISDADNTQATTSAGSPETLLTVPTLAQALNTNRRRLSGSVYSFNIGTPLPIDLPVLSASTFTEGQLETSYNEHLKKEWFRRLFDSHRLRGGKKPRLFPLEYKTKDGKSPSGFPRYDHNAYVFEFGPQGQLLDDGRRHPNHGTPSELWNCVKVRSHPCDNCCDSSMFS